MVGFLNLLTAMSFKRFHETTVTTNQIQNIKFVSNFILF